jgi:septum site-determining protein MinD
LKKWIKGFIMGISVCMASGKDGVGKSLTTANLGAVLSNMGIRTLVVDGDIKGASVGLIFGVVDPEIPSLHDCLSGRIPAEKAVIESYGTNLVVGGIKIEQLAGVSLQNLPGIIEKYSKGFEIVLVDSPGGLGSNTLMVIGSCQSLVLILTPDINSIVHAVKTLILARKVGVNVIGAVLNRAGSLYDIPSEEVSDFLRLEILGTIKEDDEVKKSIQEAVPVVLGYPNSNFSLELKRIALKIKQKTLLFHNDE